jgi:hypothetical protein
MTTLYLGTRTYGVPNPMLNFRAAAARRDGARIRFCLVSGGLAFYGLWP